MKIPSAGKRLTRAPGWLHARPAARPSCLPLKLARARAGYAIIIIIINSRPQQLINDSQDALDRQHQPAHYLWRPDSPSGMCNWRVLGPLDRSGGAQRGRRRHLYLGRGEPLPGRVARGLVASPRRCRWVRPRPIRRPTLAGRMSGPSGQQPGNPCAPAGAAAPRRTPSYCYCSWPA